MTAPDYYEIEDVKRGKGEVRATMMPPNPSTWEIDSKIGTPRNIGPSVMPRTQYSTGQKVKAVADAVADKASPLATKAVNWVFTGNTAGIKQPKRQQQAAVPRKRQSASRQKVVYVQPRVTYTKPPRQHEEQGVNPAGNTWGWGKSGKGKKKSSSGWGDGWGNK